MEYEGISADSEEFIETAKKKVLQHLEDRIQEAGKWIEPIWRRAKENQQFVKGGEHQWDKADWKARKDTKRPTFSFQDIKLAVAGVSGREITSREVATYKPRQDEAAKVAEVLREWDRFCLQEAGSEQVDSKAFRQLLIENYSWTQWRMVYDESPQGRMEHKPLRLWEMLWDPTAREKNLTDRMWDAWGGYIGIDEYLMMFPKEKDRIHESSRLDKMGFGDPKQQPTSRYPWLHRSKNAFYNSKHREVFAIDYEWKERAPAYDVLVPPGIPPSSTSVEDLQAIVAQQQQAQQAAQQPQDPSQGGQPPPQPPPFPDAEIKRLSAAEYKQFQLDYADFLEQQPDLARQLQLDPVAPANGPADGVYRWRYRRAIVVARRVVKLDDIKESDFTRQCMTAAPYEQPEGTDYIGLVDDMKDPARLKNYLTSMGVSLLQRSHKNAMIYQPGFFDDEADAEKRMSMPFAMIKAGAGAANTPTAPNGLLSGLRELETNVYPQGMDKWIETADVAVWRATGLNPQTLGSLPDARRVSGTVFSALQGAPMVVLAEMFDSLRLQKKTAGRLRLKMTECYYTPQDLKVVVGDFLSQFVPDEEHWRTLSERRIIIEEGPVHDSQKEEAWELEANQSTWSKLVEANQMPMDIFVDMIPDRWLPQAMKQRWHEWLDEKKQSGNQPPPPKPPTEVINFKDVAAANPEAASTMLQRGQLLPPQAPGGGGATPSSSSQGQG